MTVGERIRNARKIAGLTQKQLDEKSGIDEANIRKYESGKQNPKLETLEKIAKGIGFPIEYFIGWPPFDDLSLLEKKKDTILTAIEHIDPYNVDRNMDISEHDYIKLVGKYISKIKKVDTRTTDISYKTDALKKYVDPRAAEKKFNPYLSEEKQELIKIVENMSDTQVEALTNFVKQMIKSRKQDDTDEK